MTEKERDAEAVRVYQRTLGEVAESRVVAEAEDVLAHAWIQELEDMRRAALGLVAAARVASQFAQRALYEAQRSGGPAELARAHARLEAIESRQQLGVEQARTLLESVDVQLEQVCRAGIERNRRGQEDLRRLRAAWQDAYGHGTPAG